VTDRLRQRRRDPLLFMMGYATNENKNSGRPPIGACQMGLVEREGSGSDRPPLSVLPELKSREAAATAPPVSLHPDGMLSCVVVSG
jgi:hypothetical protein